MSTLLFQCLYFRERDPQSDPSCIADAVIYGIKNNGLLVFVPESVASPMTLIFGASRSSAEMSTEADRPLAHLFSPSGTGSRVRCT